MISITNLMQGYVRIEAKGAVPENLLNVCARYGVEFWRVEKTGEYTLRMNFHRRDLKRIRELARRAMCSIEIISKRGAPYFAKRFRYRYMLIAGAFLCVFAIVWSKLYIWDIEVTGNETVSTTEILNVLDECGVDIGSFWPDFISDDIRNAALLKLPELRWLTVNVRGSHATVIVRERIVKPEIVNEHLPTNVISGFSGVIVEMNVLRGTALCGVGYTVLEGDILVSGSVKSTFAETRALHAMACIKARTWRELTAVMTTEQQTKSYTGKDKTRYALVIGDSRINFYHNSGFLKHNCDKIITEHNFAYQGLFSLPIGIIKETCREYETVFEGIDINAGIELLEQELMDCLRDEIGSDGEIISAKFSETDNNGLLHVTLRAECIEQIGEIKDMTQKELQQIKEENSAREEDKQE